MSEDEPGPERKEQLTQFVFWTAVAIVVGFVLLFVIPKLL